MVFEDERLTYLALNERANQLARHLQSVGVGSESVVAISLERSVELVVGLLAILKAGGAYLPLDPELPAERLEFMLADSNAEVLVTVESLLPHLPRYGGPTVLLDADWPTIAGRDASDLAVPVSSDNLAYVIYTSGSTGRPKGVLNTHGGIVNRLLSMQDTYRLDGSDRLLQKTQISFDVSVREVFWPLLHGARLVVATPGEHGNPAYLAEVIERERITTLHFVPSMLQLFLDETDAARCRSVRCVLSGGEALSTDLVERFFEHFDCELHNLYGPTEAAVSVTTWQCERGYEYPIAPIGRPVANTKIYVLDAQFQPAPIGIWGELFIGGAQVARGYLDRPDLTAERFLANPFAPGRLYRTGDLGRWTSEGVLEFRGRIDDQVKVRGFRVELGEIETILREHEAVSSSAVAAVDAPGGQIELAAYVVLEDPNWSDSSNRPDLLPFLRAKLPDYMVPATVTVLAELPLLPNGKLDRNALPTPQRCFAPQQYVQPETQSEVELAAMWSALLETERVGRYDNFFALGGHSLLAARLVSRVCKQFDVDLPLRVFLQEPTVEALAREIRSGRPERGSQLPPLVPRTGIRECSFAQERFWFVDQVLGAGAAYNIPVGVRLRGDLDLPSLERALTEIVRRHEILRTSFSVEDGRPMQVVQPARPISVVVVDLADVEHEERERSAKQFVDDATQAPFDLTTGPLFRAHLVRLGERDNVLHFVFHHLVFDGWSKLVLYRELGDLYSAAVRGDPVQLEPRDVQYGDFAEWQRSWLQGELLEQELDYWTDALDGMPAALDLPTDRPRPAASSMQGSWSRASIPSAVVEGLHALARAEGVTFYMALLATFDLLLHRYSGQDDIAVGVPVDCRDRPELDGVIGVFVDTVVLRVDISGSPTYRDLLGRVRARMLDAIAHKRLPFEELVRALKPDRQFGRHPLYQVMLTLVPGGSTPELQGLSVEEVGSERASAPIDLTVFIEEREDGVEAIWEYSTDLFESETISRMQSHFLRLLEAVVAEPDRSIGELPLVTEIERVQALEEWGRPTTDFPVACLHELFEARVRATPDAPALAFEGEVLSYRELNERANRLAHRLRELGVEPETRVALCLRRSFELVVAVIAVLKAGGAYVPLDPDYPAERLAFVLADAQPSALVTEEELLSRLPAHEAAVVCVDRESAALAGFDSADLPPAAAPENLAYVIYTSGSTGQPKGVQVEHRNVARLFTATDEWFGFGPDDAWVLFHSYAFDFSVWELWGALLNGGRLVVAPLWTTRSPEALAELLVAERVTVLNATPTLFVSAQEELIDRAAELALRLVVFGGEALQPSALRPWFERFGAAGPRLVNMYGITETTVHVTYRELGPHDCESDTSPIGESIPDLQVYVLDGGLNPVPPGVPGELFVGGAGVARGYLNRPELTAERFLPNPFGEGRVYRSGDTARYGRDGELEFLGRNDDQVKIRGFRIELGEIQAALAGHDGVGETAVVAFEAEDGDTKLAAYVVPAAATAGPVRRALRLQSEQRLDAEQLVDLPGGMTVATLDRTEAERLYEKVFIRRVYLQHGIELPQRACVLEVGADVGLFSILVDQMSPDARIVAVEPSPDGEWAFALNAEIYGLNAELVDCVVGAASEASPDGSTPSRVRPASAVWVSRRLRTVSELLREHDLQRVDLLKISVSHGEHDVLAGVEAGDWERIHQVVVEVQGDATDLEHAIQLLEQHGFDVSVAPDEPSDDRGGRIVVGIRTPVVPVAVARRHAWLSADRLRADLRDRLEEILPGYMVPSSITLLSELPRTSNGKLDRRALPMPVWEKQSGELFAPPQTPAEIRIASIWQEVLGLDRVGTADNFFHLGGHSLLAARVVARVREEFSIALSVRALFEHATLAAFANQVTAASGVSEQPAVTAPVEPVSEAFYPPSFAQQQLLFIDELASEIATYNGALAVRVVGGLDREALERSLLDVVSRHEALRTVFRWTAEGPVQVVLDRWELAVDVIDLTHLPQERREEELRKLLSAEAGRPFDLGRDLMLRASLFRLGPDEHVLLVVTHHIASDGWSVGVFCRELGECYEAHRTGRTPRLPELPLQYRDFSQWQRSRLAGERLERELAYWRSQLAGAPTLLQLPTDRPRPQRQTFRGASCAVALPRETAEDVLRVCRDEHVTPYMLLLAVFGVLLYRVSGQDDILIGGPVANRRRSEFDQLVGFFANTLVTRVRLAGNPSFLSLLGQVRETVVDTLEHQEVPFEHIVDAVRPSRDLGVNPLVQVNFRARVDRPATPEFSDATSSRVPVDAGFAAFELALDLHVLEEGIIGEFLYNVDLFDSASIERLSEDFAALLAQVLANPGARLLALELPSEQLQRSDHVLPAGPSIRRFRDARGGGAGVTGGQGGVDQRLKEQRAVDGT